MQLMVPLRVQLETAFCSLSYFRHILKPYETELKQGPKLARFGSGWGWVGLEQVGMELDPVRFGVNEPCFTPILFYPGPYYPGSFPPGPFYPIFSTQFSDWICTGTRSFSYR